MDEKGFIWYIFAFLVSEVLGAILNFEEAHVIIGSF